MLHKGKYAKFGKYATYVKFKFGVLLFSYRNLIKQKVCSLLFLKGNMFTCVFDLFPRDRRPLLPWLWNLCCSISVHTHTRSVARTQTYKRSHVHTQRMFKMFNIGARLQAHSRDLVSHNWGDLVSEVLDKDWPFLVICASADFHTEIIDWIKKLMNKFYRLRISILFLHKYGFQN